MGEIEVRIVTRFLQAKLVRGRCVIQRVSDGKYLRLTENNLRWLRWCLGKNQGFEWVVEKSEASRFRTFYGAGLVVCWCPILVFED